jgi:nitronate monooxygenase
MLLDRIPVPLVLAPLAGGPSTPELAAAVSRAGGLGFLASGYLTAEQTSTRIGEARALTDAPLGVNVFCPGEGPAERSAYAAYLQRLREWARARDLEPGSPRYSDDDWEAKIALLLSEPVEAVSFTFGRPPVEVVESLRAAGSEVWVTITSPQEAEQALAVGADALVVQGAEAGGHRASFVDRPDLPLYGLLALLQLLGERVKAPLIATGGIASGRGLAAVLSAGARAAQVGTAFMLAPEAGTSAAHRRALASEAPTALTRAFTGRLARGIANDFMAEMANAPVAYPEIHYATAPLRGHAREQGDAQAINLWAGEAHALARELPAEEIVRRLVAEAREAGVSSSP